MTARTDTLRRRAASELEPGPRPGERKPRMRSWMVVSLAVVVAFFGLIFSRISLDRSAFVLEGLERQIVAEQTRHSELRVDVARLRAPDRISKIVEGMGLVYPAELIALEVPRANGEELSIEYRWARLRSLQTAHP